MWLIIPILVVLHIGVCALLVASVLMQMPRSEGLGAAFGGGVTENMFGAQTTNVLAKFTVWLGVAFFVLTLALAMAFAHNRPTGSRIEQDLLNSPAVPAAATPADIPGTEPAASDSAVAEPSSTNPAAATSTSGAAAKENPLSVTGQAVPPAVSLEEKPVMTLHPEAPVPTPAEAPAP